MASINNQAFENMITSAEADKSRVSNLFGEKKTPISKEVIHNSLMAAGFTPGLGNIADAADAILYAFEGEFGSAAVSAAAMIPFIGQTVSAKKALKAAKESGEEIVTLYRGSDKWHKGTMVKDGKFIGKEKLKHIHGGVGFSKDSASLIGKSGLYTTTNPKIAKGYSVSVMNAAKDLLKRGRASGTGPLDPPAIRELQGIIDAKANIMLKFEVPKSFINKYGIKSRTIKQNVPFGEALPGDNYIFVDGLPKAFLTKVTKGKDLK